jgi:hypothetical protein
MLIIVEVQNNYDGICENAVNNKKTIINSILSNCLLICRKSEKKMLKEILTYLFKQKCKLQEKFKFCNT